MNNTVRQHYIPEFYLKGFLRSDRNVFWIYDREMDEYRPQTPNDTTVKRHFYTIDDSEGNKKYEVENALAYLEGLAKPILDKLDCGEQISQDEKGGFAVFISNIIMRTPEFQKSVEKMYAHMAQKISKMAFSTRDRARESLRQIGVENLSDDELDEHVAFSQSDDYELIVNKTEPLRMMVELTRDIALLFVQMEWCVIHCEHNTSFVTSDDPFIVMPPTEWQPSNVYGYGYLTPGTQKFLPLTQKTALAILDKGDAISHLNVNRDFVRRFNLNIAIRSQRFLIARDEALIKSIVKRTHIDTKEPYSKLHITN